MNTFLICLAAYLAIGCAIVWAFYKNMTPEVWWGWLVVIVAWPIFLWRVARS